MSEAASNANTAQGGSNLMAGKRSLIMGVANNRSIAWGIAKACAAHGAELAFTYQGDALLKRITPLAESIGTDTDLIMPCDVPDAASMDAGGPNGQPFEHGRAAFKLRCSQVS